MSHVHIVTADRGWILERLAKEIAAKLNYVTYSTHIDETAEIQYYFTYSAFRRKVSPIEIGYFAHLEIDQEARDKFFLVARSVDHCVCHARLYEGIIREHGIENVTTISPGVDFDEMRPTIKIGVVGRTYHTGRKGESLIQAVYDTPGIEWHFTGSGWPGPARNVPDGEMGIFYNEMDYILVPALYEGGPMCVVEALACGTPVIAPPIGWVPEFPHHEYKTGDVEDLRRVLNQIVAERQKMRDAVLDRTWESWAHGHDVLFRELLAKRGLTPSPASGASYRIGQVALLLHGNEGRTLGGPSVRAPQTAKHLRELGYDVQTGIYPDLMIKSASVVHGFNIWSPHMGVEMARGVRAQNKPLVLSSIFLDLSERPLWQDQIPELFKRVSDPELIDRELATLREQFQYGRNANRLPIQGAPGHHEAVREMIEIADHVILLSENERRQLEAIGAKPRAATVIRNAVDPERFGSADPLLFADAFGVKDYILCVARLEARKNQLILLHALRDLDLPIVLVGHGQDKAYFELMQRYEHENVKLVGRIDPNSPLLPSAVAGARVFTLPSWSEGAPLAALEAAATGTNMVLSNRSSEREYFGDHARYCDPGDPASIRTAILEAYDSPHDEARRQGLREFVALDYSWGRYARETAEVYKTTLDSFVPSIELSHPPATPKPGFPKVVFDVTTSCYHKGRWTGISRFEMSVAQALMRRTDVETYFVAWHDQTQRFVQISLRTVGLENLAFYHDYAGKSGIVAQGIPRGARLVAGGSAWMQNTNYANGLVEFTQAADLILTFAIHDIIPCIFPFWFSEGYAPIFERNLGLLLSAAGQVLAVSRHTASDVERFCFQHNIPVPPIGVFREGDDISSSRSSEEAELNTDPAFAEKFSARPFILNVGAIHARKNHRLLYELWLRLVERHGSRCPRLVIVGGVAWNGTDVARAFLEDKRLVGVVHILENIDDAALDWLYENSLFTIYPSLYEGWGLPVAESLTRGKICIAAKTSSVPEISSEFTDLIDPMDFNGWLTRISMYLVSPPARAAREAQIRDGYRGLTWDESVDGMLDAMTAAQPEVAPRRPYVLGTRLSMSKREPANVLAKFGGWHPSESWGTWASSQSARLVVRLARPPEGDIVLAVVARALVVPFSCEVVVNGEKVGHSNFISTQARLLSFHVPHDLIKSRRSVEIELRSSNVIQVKAISSKSKDERQVSIGLIEVILAPARNFIVADLGVDNSLLNDGIPLGERFWLPHITAQNRFFATPMVVNSTWGARSPTGAPVISLKIHEAPGEDVELELTYRAIASADAPFRALVIARDGTVVGNLEAHDDAVGTTRMMIDRRIRSLGCPIELRVVATRGVKSPHELKIGAEESVFGIGLFSIGLTIPGRELSWPSVMPTPASYGELIEFKAPPSNNSAASYLVPGYWHEQEENGVWSIGKIGRLSIPLHQIPVDDLLLDLNLGVYQIDAKAPSTIIISVVNGPTISFEMEYGTHSVEIRLPLSDLDIDPSRPNLVVDIIAERGLSPFRTNGSPDDREIGVYLSSLVLREWRPVEIGRPIELP